MKQADALVLSRETDALAARLAELDATRLVAEEDLRSTVTERDNFARQITVLHADLERLIANHETDRGREREFFESELRHLVCTVNIQYCVGFNKQKIIILFRRTKL